MSTLAVVDAAHAAGLGRLTVLSGLGQPLRAEIDLTSVTRDEASSLAAKLASPDAYRQAGIEYNATLLGVRFAIDRRPDGQYFIRLSSNQPVNDPIVDALVELTWASGRLVREYTFLLDPVDMRPAAVAAPEAKPSAPVAVAPKPAPAPTPAPVAAPAPVRPAVPAQAAAVSGTYEVKRGDTLGKIARQSLTDGVTLDQMMVALQRANQDAFVGGNINRLKSGVILNVPDKEAAGSVAPADARRLVVAQSADFKSYAEKLAGGVQAAPTAKAEQPKQESKGKITAKVEDKAAAGAGADKLKLSKADPDAAKGAAGAKPKAAAEDKIAKERELRDAKARQAELERNVKDLQKLAEIKNQNLAELQKQAQAKGAAPQVAQAPIAAPAAPAKAAEPAKAAPAAAVTPVPPKAPEPPKSVAPEPAKAIPAKAPDAPKVEAPKVEAPKAAEPAKAPDAPKAGLDATKVAEAPKTDPAKGGDAPKADAAKAEPPKADAPKAEPPKAPEVAAKADPKPAPKKAAPPPPPPPEPSLVDEFLGNPMYLAGGGGVLALLGGYAAFAVRRKRKEATTGFENSIVTGGDLKANSVFGNTGGQVDTGNSSFQSDFSAETPGAVDTDEVDPIAEADVYMAYGRDAQAEEILKEALQKDPSRQTVRLKLLEVYSQRGDAAAFGATVGELHAATGGQGEQWERAAALGLQVDPANPLYGGGGGAAAAVNAGGDSISTVALGAGALSAAAAAAASSADKTVTLPAFGAAAAPASADDPMTKTVALEAMQGQTPASIDLDFDLGGDTQEAAPAADVSLALDKPASAAPSIDFDLGFGDAPAAAPEPAPAPVAAAMDTDFAPGGTVIIDAPPALDPGMPSSDKTQELPATAAPASADGGMSVDFDFDLGSGDAAPVAAPVAAAAAPAAGGGGVDFDFGSLSLELPDSGGDAAASAAPMDDVSTKLDQAKAYQEMGDKDGARELLKEVLAEGSDAQKAEANALIAALG